MKNGKLNYHEEEQGELSKMTVTNNIKTLEKGSSKLLYCRKILKLYKRVRERENQ